MPLAVPGIGILPVSQGKCPQCRGEQIGHRIDPARVPAVESYLKFKEREPWTQLGGGLLSVLTLGVWAIVWGVHYYRKRDERAAMKAEATERMPESIRSNCRECGLEWFPDQAFEISQLGVRRPEPPPHLAAGADVAAEAQAMSEEEQHRAAFLAQAEGAARS